MSDEKKMGDVFVGMLPIYHEMDTKDSYDIISADGGHLGGGFTKEEAEAICLAVNSHDEITARLEEARKLLVRAFEMNQVFAGDKPGIFSNFEHHRSVYHQLKSESHSFLERTK